MPAEVADVRRGHDFHLAWATDLDTPVWDEFDNATSVTESKSADLQAVDRRKHGRKQYVPGAKDEGVSIECAHFEGDTDREAFDTAYENETQIAVIDFNGPIATSGSSGKQRNVYVGQDEFSKPFGQPSTHKYDLKEAVGDAPSTVTIA